MPKTQQELQKKLEEIWSSFQEEGLTVGEMLTLVDALRNQINSIALNKPVARDGGTKEVKK